MNNFKNKENNRKALKWIYLRTRHFIPAVICISFIALISSISLVSLAIISKDVIDIATGDKDGSLFKYAVLLFSAILIQIASVSVSMFLKSYTNGKMTISVRNYLFLNVVKKKYYNISCYHSGDLLNRFTSDIDVVVNNAVNIIPNVISIFTKIIAGIGALFILNKYLALIILLIGIAVPAVGRLINKRYKHLHKECQRTEGQARSFLQECFENIVVIKTFISEKPFTKKLNQYMGKNFHAKMKRTGISIVTNMGLYSFFTLGYYVVLLWGAGKLSSGTLTYGTLTAFLQLISQLRSPLQNISGIIPQYYSALASTERLMEIDNLSDEKKSVSDIQLEKIKSDFSSLEINNITFGYDNETVLENCCINVKKGHITALTGESGSGKSTLFKIILGLYEPNSGSITINGNTATDTSLRGMFSYVPQGNMVLSGTIRENITLWNSDIGEEQLENAVKAADIYDYIVSLPQGFETVLSERGAGLSEGQIQRISIARALLFDAPILLLDEATSALDEVTETNVLSNIKKMTDKTVLFITHRNTSLQVCDEILHIQDKKFSAVK